jgi:hypothetical protein
MTTEARLHRLTAETLSTADASVRLQRLVSEVLSPNALTADLSRLSVEVLGSCTVVVKKRPITFLIL